MAYILLDNPADWVINDAGLEDYWFDAGPSFNDNGLPDYNGPTALATGEAGAYINGVNRRSVFTLSLVPTSDFFALNNLPSKVRIKLRANTAGTLVQLDATLNIPLDPGVLPPYTWLTGGAVSSLTPGVVYTTEIDTVASGINSNAYALVYPNLFIWVACLVAGNTAMTVDLISVEYDPSVAPPDPGDFFTSLKGVNESL